MCGSNNISNSPWKFVLSYRESPTVLYLYNYYFLSRAMTKNYVMTEKVYRMLLFSRQAKKRCYSSRRGDEICGWVEGGFAVPVPLQYYCTRKITIVRPSAILGAKTQVIQFIVAPIFIVGCLGHLAAVLSFHFFCKREVNLPRRRVRVIQSRRRII